MKNIVYPTYKMVLGLIIKEKQKLKSSLTIYSLGLLNVKNGGFEMLYLFFNTYRYL